MYADTHVPPLVTTGEGDYVPLDVALTLPWIDARTGQPATQDAIVAEWNMVNGNVEMGRRGALYAQTVTSLRLSPPSEASLVAAKYDSNAQVLMRYFPDLPTLPPNARWAVMSLAWGMGPGYPPIFPHFTAAINNGDWATARDECTMEGEPAPVNRNTRGYNALDYLAQGGDPTQFTVPVPDLPAAA
jgi:hypothetical protein